jgi:hypothetical protein
MELNGTNEQDLALLPQVWMVAFTRTDSSRMGCLEELPLPLSERFPSIAPMETEELGSAHFRQR